MWLDFAADDSSDNNPFLKAFDSSDTLLASATAGFVPLGGAISLMVSAPNIAYITGVHACINKNDLSTLCATVERALRRSEAERKHLLQSPTFRLSERARKSR